MRTGKYEFKVNGFEFTTENRQLTASEILAIAIDGKAVANPKAAEGYILQGDKGKYQGSAQVDLTVDNVFITIPTGPTPVA